jgi:hypothetical protein
MSAQLGKNQVYDAQSWQGMTTSNHLGSIYHTAPQKASNILTKLLSANYGPNLDTMLSKFPVKYFESDDEFTWDLIGSLERNYQLVEARAAGAVVTSSDSNVGAAGQTIELVFGEKCFSDVNVIVGEKNEIYPLRVLEDPTPEGGNWVYKCELMGGVIDGMPGAELVLGKRFSKDYSPVEDTLSYKGGDIGFNSTMALRNEFSAIRMQHTAPGNMRKRRVIAPFYSVDPKTQNEVKHEMWMEHVEWVFEYQFAQEKSRLLMFATTNRDVNGDYRNIGKSGHVIKMGSGIREQMEVSNTLYYNTFSIKMLTNMLTELSEGKLSMDDRHFVLRTGERGAKQFHEAVTVDGAGWQGLANNVGFDNTNTNSVQKTSSPLHSNAYSAGFQFTEFLAPNGVKVTLEVDAMYDDKIRNKIEHPDGGVAESYRYDILYIGTLDGEPNIQKAMVKENDDLRRWEYGLRNPFPSAPDWAGIMSNSIDGATYHRACMGVGAIVRDPSRTASLIPSILAA